MKIVIRYQFAIFLLFVATQGWSEIKPIVPRDVFTESEIADINERKDFFLREHLLDDKPLWNHLDRKYGHHYLKPRVHSYSLENVLHETLSNGFPTRYKIQELYRANMNRHIAIGKLLPSLNLTIGEGSNPINPNNLFLNMFGFLLPHNWFSLIQAQHANEATKYLFLKTVLDQYYTAEFIYLDVHHLIQDFEIYNFYFIHLQLLDAFLTNTGRHDPALAANYATIGTSMASQRGSIKLRFDDLAEVMALRLDRNGKYAADFLNIENVQDFPERVKQLEEVGALYNNKENFITEVLKRSVEMRAVNELYKAAKMGIGVTASGNILSGKDSPTDNYLRLGINFGYDTIPRILSSVSQATTAKIDVESQLVQMIEAARRAFDASTNSIGGHTEAQRSMKLNRQAFAVQLKRIVEDNQPIDGYFLRTLSNLMESEFKLNNALHGTLKAHALMRRLLVTEEKNVLEYLPNHAEVRKIQRLFIADFADEKMGRSHIDKIVRHMHRGEKLKTFLAGEYINIDGSADKIEKEDVNVIVSDKMPDLLRRKVFRHRSQNYYSTLNQYVDDNKIFLTDFDKNKLERRAGLPVKKLKPENYQWLSKTSAADEALKNAQDTTSTIEKTEYMEKSKIEDDTEQPPKKIEKLGHAMLISKA
jgi:hypothetical protein